MREVFAAIPDDEATLRRDGLAFFHYRAVPGAKTLDEAGFDRIEALIEQGVLIATPMTYEDFLPVSAAGIFQSNLNNGMRDQYVSQSRQDLFEQALGEAVIDEIELYERRQQASLERAFVQLNVAQG